VRIGEGVYGTVQRTVKTPADWCSIELYFRNAINTIAAAKNNPRMAISDNAGTT